MAASAEYAVVLPLAPLRVGEWIDRSAWPLHVTLVTDVLSDAGPDRLVGVLREASKRLPPLSGTVGEEAWFGRDVLVDLVDSDALPRAHVALLDALEQHAGAVPLVPAYHRDGYRAHATVARSGRVTRGELLRFGSIALVEIGTDGRPDIATPVALFELGAASAPPAVVDAVAARRMVEALTGAQVAVAVIGGWGVDALLGEVTREHHDLDVLIEVDDLPRLLDALPGLGLTVRYLWSENRWIGEAHLPSAFVADGALGELDVHVVLTSASGPVPLSASTVDLPQDALGGTGTIDGLPVRCATAEAQRRMHAGYELPPHHRADLERLDALD